MAVSDISETGGSQRKESENVATPSSAPEISEIAPPAIADKTTVLDTNFNSNSAPEAVKAARRECSDSVSPRYVWKHVRHLSSSDMSEDGGNENEQIKNAPISVTTPEKIKITAAELANQNTAVVVKVGERNAVTKWGQHKKTRPEPG